MGEHGCGLPTPSCGKRLPELRPAVIPCLQLAGEMKAKGIERNVHTYTVRGSVSQHAGYQPTNGRPCCVAANPVTASLHGLNRAGRTSAPTPLQALMNVCIKCSKHSLALDTYKLMRQDRCTPNVVT